MKTSVYIATSLDGFIAREDGSLDWLPGSDGSTSDQETGADDFGYQAFMDSIDVLVMGRNTYELVLSFGQWPYGDKRVVVLSNSLTSLPNKSPETATLWNGSITELLKTLEADGATHLYIDGGKTIQSFLRAGHLHELIITRVPILIGQGIPLFGPLDEDINLQHLETQAYNNGFVQSKYKVS